MIQDKPRQKIFNTLGATGCYFFSLLHAAEKITGQYIDAFGAFLMAGLKGWIKDDCFVTDPDEILSWFTGKTWTMTKEGPDYACTDLEVEILRYEWQETTTLHGHFVCGDRAGGIEYDPYGDSLTVKNGKLASKRIFRKA
jgi:hypothetical protein